MKYCFQKSFLIMFGSLHIVIRPSFIILIEKSSVIYYIITSFINVKFLRFTIQIIRNRYNWIIIWIFIRVYIY